MPDTAIDVPTIEWLLLRYQQGDREAARLLIARIAPVLFHGFSWPIAGAGGLARFTAVEFFFPYVDVAHIVTNHVFPAAVAGLGSGRN